MASPPVQQLRYNVPYITLDALKNEVDTDRMRARLLASGFASCRSRLGLTLQLSTPFILGFSNRGVWLETTLEIAEALLRESVCHPLLCVGWCSFQVWRRANEQLPEAAAFVPADQEDGIVSCCRRSGISPEPTQSIVAAHGMLRTIDGASAFVKISEGCDRFFALAPFRIIGHYH